MPFDPLRLDRRQLLKTFGAAAVTALSIPTLGRTALASGFIGYPFRLGVASGDPAPDGFVIWTRLAPRPLEPGYGMPAAPVAVDWQVAEDPAFRQIVQKGEAVARPELGHAVHVEVTGLQPGRTYHYRFLAGEDRSIPGRARTAPAVGAPVDRVRFAVCGCQSYEQGYYTAFRHMADEELDFVYHYGDYIYEGPVRPFFFDRFSEKQIPQIRFYEGNECYSLEDYRRRYALYKMDTDLQMAHAAAAFVQVWDDHEIQDNWVSDKEKEGAAPVVFLLRRAAAAQAFYEHMPLRRSSWPFGSNIQLYRRLAFGNLLDFNVLDTRQYRSDQPCNDGFKPACPDVDNPQLTALGAEQEAWLNRGLIDSKAKWSVLGQQILMMPVDRSPGSNDVRNLDSWDSYRAARQRLLKTLDDNKLRNVVVLSGDEHQNYAGELKIDDRDPTSRTLATEFCATSISSGADGGDQRRLTPGILAENPHLKLINDQRGYLINEVTPDAWTASFKVLDRVTVPDGKLSVRARFAVERGKPGLNALS